jgi:tetratricopeptide (TPR) repeat protein
MKQKLTLALISLALLLPPAPPARAQAEASAVWQVTRFDITASVPSGASERTLAARAVVSARNVGRGTGRTFTARINPAAEVKTVTVGDAAARFDTRPESRSQLKQVQAQLPAPVAPGGTLSVAYDYTIPLPVANTGLAAISVEGAQFLPLSGWYPTPNSPVSPRGADSAPLRLTVNAAGGESVVSAGQTTAAGAATYELPINAQPFFVTGRWDAVEGAGEARGVSALLPRGAGADERKRAEALVALAGAARAHFSALLGPAPDVPVRLVAVRRGAGFDSGGTLLLDAAAFRRAKTDAVTALSVAETVAHLWLGGVTPLVGEGAGAVREGLARHLAVEFIAKQFGAEAAEAERLRGRVAYAAVARRDAPLALTTPLDPTYFTSTANKGAMIWRLAERAVGRDAFVAVLREQLQAGREAGMTLAALRAALNERGGAQVKAILDAGLDQPTDLDLLIGMPRPGASGDQLVALRNTGSSPLTVRVVGWTASGERLSAEAAIPARDFGEASFKTQARVTRVEIDPEKLHPQLDYSNDTMPAAPPLEESLQEATRTLAAQEFARSESAARAALALAPLLQDARILLARALLGQNKLDEAEREFRAAYDSPLPQPDTLALAPTGLGEIALRRGRVADAERLLDEGARAGGSGPAVFIARTARLRAQTAQGASAPQIDETVRAAVAALDQAIKSGRKAELDAIVAPGELVNFSKGIVGSQPEAWQSRLLRTESLGGDRFTADVQIAARMLGQERNSTALLVFARSGGRLVLVDIPILEDR